MFDHKRVPFNKCSHSYGMLWKILCSKEDDLHSWVCRFDGHNFHTQPNIYCSFLHTCKICNAMVGQSHCDMRFELSQLFLKHNNAIE